MLRIYRLGIIRLQRILFSILSIDGRPFMSLINDAIVMFQSAWPLFVFVAIAGIGTYRATHRNH